MKVKLQDLNFASYNPRVITDAEMGQLKAGLKEYGLVTSLVVQKKGMTLIGGHQRVRALRELFAEADASVPEELWAVVLDVDDATAKRLNVSLNKTGGQFDDYKLGELFSGMDEMLGSQVTAMGFDNAEVEELIRSVSEEGDLPATVPEPSEDITVFARSVTLTLEFDTVDNRDLAKDLLKTRAHERGVKVGNLVLSLLGPRSDRMV